MNQLTALFQLHVLFVFYIFNFWLRVLDLADQIVSFAVHEFQFVHR